jgi:hypothetical protein
MQVEAGGLKYQQPKMGSLPQASANAAAAPSFLDKASGRSTFHLDKESYVDLLKFAECLGATAIAIEIAKHEVIERACVSLETTAKDAIGNRDQSDWRGPRAFRLGKP